MGTLSDLKANDWILHAKDTLKPRGHPFPNVSGGSDIDLLGVVLVFECDHPDSYNLSSNLNEINFYFNQTPLTLVTAYNNWRWAKRKELRTLLYPGILKIF